MPTKPLARNVLFIMADELSRFGVGCYHEDLPAALRRAERPPAITPNLDRLAQEGLRFTAAYSPSPICVPARAAIATGKPVHEIGCWSSAEPYDGQLEGWSHKLRAAGYDVSSIGKLHFRGHPDDDYGFTEEILPTHVIDQVGWTKALLRQPLAAYGATGDLASDVGAGDSSYLRYDRSVCASAVEWLQKPARQSKPWASFVSFFSPHYPLLAPEDDYRLYDPAQLSGQGEEVPDHPVLQQIGGFFDYDRHFTPESRGQARAAYYGLCTFVDSCIGKILQTLEESGQRDDTLIIFTADHGEMLGHKGFWTKSVMYEDSAGVPLIIAPPETTATVTPQPVDLTELSDCILQAVGQQGDGTVPSLLGPLPDGKTALSQYHDGGAPTGLYMIRWKNWKYVHYADGSPSQLFDLATDPYEEDDQATVQPEVLAEGERRLRDRLDPEAVNRQAFSDQAERITQLGGREKLAGAQDWGYTPAES
ncbi:sulfatase-like hydrolase/transferase [Rhodovibrionaceae bacterium A322]